MPKLAGPIPVFGIAEANWLSAVSDASDAWDGNPYARACARSHPIRDKRRMRQNEGLDAAVVPLDVTVWDDEAILGGSGPYSQRVLPGEGWCSGVAASRGGVSKAYFQSRLTLLTLLTVKLTD